MQDILTDYLELLDRTGESSHDFQEGSADAGEPAEFADSEKDAELYTDAFARLCSRGMGDRWTVRDGSTEVQIWISDDNTVDGNRETTLPSITVAHGYGDNERVVLTWQMARALALAIGQAESLARRG
jgi:hypothetical protein